MFNLLFQPEHNFGLDTEYGLALRFKCEMDETLALAARQAPIAQCLMRFTDKGEAELSLRVLEFVELGPVDHAQAQLPSQVVQRQLGQLLYVQPLYDKAPSLCVEELQNGLQLSLIPTENGFDAQLHGAQTWQLVKAEDSHPSFVEPVELAKAKAVIARRLDQISHRTEQQLHLLEIEQACQSLSHWMRHGGAVLNQHQGVYELLNALRQRHEFLQRQIQHGARALDIGSAANDAGSLHAERQAQLYRLLASPELTAAVDQLLEEE
ncbi:hypothetical protein [Paraferrimonas sedimenticola]|uniref:Uncharacterized protein n=1 Tax=Paraferrimonas sedimenticola TaxID=375674 RepID=A0AA37RWL5_9GAMM|nr:hypothetical protein [Paraferrimonas sedimenticola]GLP96483.1 hypothetical protein GCM10007895_17890 [Paraferrimonas sedimenticola]